MRNLFQWVILFLTHPLVLLFLFISVDTYFNFKDIDPDKMALKAVQATKRALMYSIIDAEVYGNWVFDVTCLCLVPVWSSFWFLSWHPLPKLKTN